MEDKSAPTKIQTPAIPSPQQERRKRGRLKRACLIRVRPSTPGPNQFEEILQTTNISRTGVYFISTTSFYFKGMRLFVTCPYSAKFNAINQDYVAEVVRVKPLPDGQYGVAAHFLSTLYL